MTNIDPIQHKLNFERFYGKDRPEPRMISLEPTISDEHAYRDHQEVDGPHWPDDCGHGGYVGTVWTMPRDGERDIIDVYVFKSELHDANVCLRYGRHGFCYTPGPVNNLLRLSDFDIYNAAAKLILAKGTITWQPTV